MPESRYFIAGAVLTALFAFRDRDCEAIFAAFDQIAESPRDSADAMGRDWDNRLVCIAHFGRFEIGCVIAAGAETVTFTLLRPGRK